ncbi:multidrug efflux protein [Legionella moravica]|uniref:Multidrug efflux protein n=1 Tax=Legionella moravica TaxID=39962 RepID=A0A378K2C8_9GAMM|nr:multidrug efflux protein [Legionella moravica]STX63409.1 putative restriction endonuclease-like [Legionella moravica]
MIMPIRGKRVGERELDKAGLRQYAKILRSKSTDSENRLWHYLRAKRLGFKFKRQVPIGFYIVDFMCLEKRLIIELDGGQHLDNQEYDMTRTAWLNERGYKVLRFWNNDVLQQTATVLEAILRELAEFS